MIYTHAGPEIAVASTKAFLAQITACTCTGLYLAQLRGGAFADEARAVMRDLREMPDKIQTVLDRLGRVREIARFMADTRSVLFLGRHVGFPVALEGALKLKEIAYIHAEGFAAGELKHGPIALIEPGQPVFVIDHGPGCPAVACQGRLEHPGDPGPWRPHVGRRPGRRRTRSMPFHERDHQVPATAPPRLAAVAHRRSPPGLCLRVGDGQGAGRRPAA